MKKFYAWYQKHITGAIFIGLLLGILTGLFRLFGGSAEGVTGK